LIHQIPEAMKTMIKISNAVLLMSLFSLITGCACYYAPNAQNVPLFSEKGQVSTSGSFQIGGATYGFNVQGAAAVSEHVGLMGNYNFFSDNFMTTSNMGEIGVGYFDNFRQMGNAVFETYAGIGAGRVKIDIADGLQLVNTTSFFIQPDIGYNWNKFRLAFSTRFRVVHFNIIRNDNLSSGYYIYEQGTNQFNIGFIEPAVTCSFGSKMIRFQYQLMLSYAVGDIHYYDMINSNFGLVFCLQPKKHAK
jgi:hypothetical protein